MDNKHTAKDAKDAKIRKGGSKTTGTVAVMSVEIEEALCYYNIKKRH